MKFRGVLLYLFGALVASEQCAAEVHGSAPAKSARRQLKIVKGVPPSDAKYLEFLRWHEQHSVLSVIVSSENRAAAQGVLEKLGALKKRNVLIGEVIVLGKENLDLFASIENMPVPSREEYEKIWRESKIRRRAGTSYADYLRILSRLKIESSAAAELGLTSSSSIPAHELLARYDIRYSPTWIVRFQGKNYIYEGNVDPRRLFTADGRFTGSDANF